MSTSLMQRNFLIIVAFVAAFIGTTTTTTSSSSSVYVQAWCVTSSGMSSDCSRSAFQNHPRTYWSSTPYHSSASITSPLKVPTTCLYTIPPSADNDAAVESSSTSSSSSTTSSSTTSSSTTTTTTTMVPTKQSPPESFYELQQDCTKAVQLAREDGYNLLEIEFPPLPANVMEMDDVSAYDVARANLQLAIDFGKTLISTTASPYVSSTGTPTKTSPVKKVTILFPDLGETKIAIEKFMGGTNVPYPGIVIESIRGRMNQIDDRIFQPEQLLLGIFGGTSNGAVQPVPDTDVYVCLTFSAQELPDIEELYNSIYNQTDGTSNSNDETSTDTVTDNNDSNNNNAGAGADADAGAGAGAGAATTIINKKKTPPTIILYNLKLDTLRGDLGAPAFPSKQFQYRFLSKIKPVYYLRTRQYSRSITKPPFVVNFQGCLFRSYPGNYQTLLDTGYGQYRRICTNTIRPALGQFKQQLIDELANQGVLPPDNSSSNSNGSGGGNTFLNFLRSGYKVTTWWEDEECDRLSCSNDWKT